MPEQSDAEVHFELTDHLPYLFKHIHSQLEVASAGQLARFGINVAVWRIIAVLWEHDGLSHRELAELTSIEVSTLSRLSKAVQRDGFIRRKRTKEDQRTVRVTLTDKGRALAQEVIPWANECEATMVGKLSNSDVQTLRRILHVIAENMNGYSRNDLDIAGDPPGAKAPVKRRAAATKGKPPKASPVRKRASVAAR